MNNILFKNYFPGLMLFLAGFLLLLPFFNPELILIPSLIYLLIFCLALLLKRGLALNLLFLFIFAGTLFSVDIGFTLKASQVFAIFAIFNLLLQFFNSVPRIRDPLGIYFEKTYNKITITTIYPFLVFLVSILPSLIMPALFSDLYEGGSSIRALFNLLFLQIICLVIFMGTFSKNKLKSALLLCFTSYLLILSFGFAQQLGYYMGVYDPFQYIGNHSLFVDLYGPFLRISPGTFANEFGEILQSAAITLTTVLVLMKNNLQKKTKLILKFSLVITIIALILNFTRASWLIYIFYLFCLFFIAKPKLKTKAIIFTITTLVGTGIYFIFLKTDFFIFISILDRFSELYNLTNDSAGVRLEIWKESWALFMNSPIIGNGWGTTIETHNVPLELLSETGIIGFFGFYFLMVILLKRFYKMKNITTDPFLKTISISIFYTLIGCLMFDLTNHGIYHFILWLIIGLGLATERIVKGER